MAKKKPTVPISKPAVPAVTDTERVVENALKVLDNEVAKLLARSLTSSASSANYADIRALGAMLKSILEVQAERRVSAITKEDAAKLSDEQLAAEIKKLLDRKAARSQ